MNRLAQENSAYLKHAASQKVDWYPWSEQAFDRARESDRPVFLSTGAVWCHWCHVMAQECFHDDEVCEILNTRFISIKLDRDERPDVDRRYQMAVSAMGSGGGWPLSVFLTPDKVPFFGGTYFPPEDSMGRPGFKKVLRAVHELYHTKKDEIGQYTDRLMNALKTQPVPAGEIRESHIDDAVKRMLTAFDSQNGGFGTAPKFPMPGAIDFILNRYYLTGDESLGLVVRKTLDAMAAGGFRDHIGGGFHRYSTDQSWVIPHFEKMADDNAWLLRNYLSAYALWGDSHYRTVAEGIIGFVRDVLSDPEGVFFASQDADVTPDDEGGYFTWRDEDFRRVLDDHEYGVMSSLFMHEAGAMHHDHEKRVLFAGAREEDIAEKYGMSIDHVLRLVRSGKEKLRAERNRRETPYIDRTLYTSINGMLISVFIMGSRILNDSGLRDYALKILDRVMERMYLNRELYHAGSVRALLDDYVFLIDALLAAYEVTGEGKRIVQASELMEVCIQRLWDEKEGGFFDTDEHLLGMGIKAVEDIPHPSANACAIRLLQKLSAVTGQEEYRIRAEKALAAFAPRAREMGIHAGYYFSALDAYFNPLKLALHTRPGEELCDRALSLFSPHTDIVYHDNEGYVVACIGDSCREPVRSTGELERLFRERKKALS